MLAQLLKPAMRNMAPPPAGGPIPAAASAVVTARMGARAAASRMLASHPSMLTHRRFFEVDSTSEQREPYRILPHAKPVEVSTPEEALEGLRSGSGIFVHGAVATPQRLVGALTEVADAKGLKDMTVMHIHTEGPSDYARHPAFNTRCFFTGANMRAAVNEGSADYIPIFLSEIPLLFRRGVQPINTALIQVSPPDEHGFCTLGTSVDIARAAVQMADTIVAQVNPNMPRTFGDGVIHISHISRLLPVDDELPELHIRAATDVEARIASFISEELIEDGATLQMGIGAIPDTVLSFLDGHKDLGIHTEMFCDGVKRLVEIGAVSNARKAFQPGCSTVGFCMGSKSLYQWLDNNPSVVFKDIAWVNSTTIASQHPKMTAINSAIEVDLTGQVVSDSIGNRIFSGVGGQVDFIRAASLCPDGKPIIALPSRTNKGRPRIVPYIQNGSGVVTSRAHVHYVVTEYGIANLFGKSIAERARALIDVAHPEDREMLEKAAFERVHKAV